MLRVKVKPQLLRWARKRAGVDVDQLVKRFPKYRQWESGEVWPTLKQLETLAKATRAPVGCFFLSEPLDESLSLPDFRTIGSTTPKRFSPDLLDTVGLCQQRQEWYRDFARHEGQEPLPFIGSETLNSKAETVAARIRSTLNFDLPERKNFPTWEDALRGFIERTEGLGVLVMVSGVVDSNTHRPLDPDEFRGFALSDDIAPLLFINGADTKSAQIFTLAHELAHLWLGKSALSNSRMTSEKEHEVEAWCNRVAAEILVPLDAVRKEYRKNESPPDATKRLRKEFKVSSLVILRRIYDAGKLSREVFRREYHTELARLKEIMDDKKKSKGGGSYYASQTARGSRRFARAVVSSTLEGRTLYRDALHLLGFSSIATFHEFADTLGLS